MSTVVSKSGVTVTRAALTDPRFAALARALRLADADHARGKMLAVWWWCTERMTYAIEPRLLDAMLGDGSADALVTSDLGELMPDGSIRIKGTKERIEWLEQCRRNGRKGGRPKGPSKKTKSAPGDAIENRPVNPSVRDGFDFEEKEKEQEKKPVVPDPVVGDPRSHDHVQGNGPDEPAFDPGQENRALHLEGAGVPSEVAWDLARHVRSISEAKRLGARVAPGGIFDRGLAEQELRRGSRT